VDRISSAIDRATLRRVAKMNGLGNEIVVLDLRGSGIGVTPDQARAIHRTEGLAFDQLMVLFDPRQAGTAAFMRIYNNDGSESGACGNGTRCVAYLLLRGRDQNDIRLQTGAGVLDCRRESEFSFRVDMGEPRLEWNEIPLRDAVHDTRRVGLPVDGRDDADLRTASVANMGNPHAVFWIRDFAALDLAAIGPLFENHAMFPDKANISFAHVAARDHIELRVWERGVGLTRACGSAACATLVAAVRDGLTARQARVTLPGGDLTIEWRQADNRVLMTGPVELESETSVAL
jgi:diaminopimelate epimerase